MTVTTIDINRTSLAQLSLSAFELWDEIDNCPDNVDLIQLYEQLLDIQNATEAKVDAIAWVADQLKDDLETWEDRLKRVTLIYSNLIQRRRNQLEKLKGYLLRLHQLGLLPEKVAGNERCIDFQNNPPSVVVTSDPANSSFPERFKEVKVTAKPKEILAAHKAGEDISAIAEIHMGKHVRFRFLSTKSRKLPQK